jgi:anti-sigma regulatory factor (Ser/Thr protein kinase)
LDIAPAGAHLSAGEQTEPGLAGRLAPRRLGGFAHTHGPIRHAGAGSRGSLRARDPVRLWGRVTPLQRQMHIRRSFVAEPQAPRAVRRELEALDGELTNDELWRLALLVTELVTNSILHAGLGGRGIVTVDVAVTDSRVRAEVRDRGMGFEPSVPDEPLAGHWGMRLLDRLSDYWQVDGSRGTAVLFELKRRIV